MEKHMSRKPAWLSSFQRATMKDSTTDLPWRLVGTRLMMYSPLVKNELKSLWPRQMFCHFSLARTTNWQKGSTFQHVWRLCSYSLPRLALTLWGYRKQGTRPNITSTARVITCFLAQQPPKVTVGYSSGSRNGYIVGSASQKSTWPWFTKTLRNSLSYFIILTSRWSFLLHMHPPSTRLRSYSNGGNRLMRGYDGALSGLWLAYSMPTVELGILLVVQLEIAEPLLRMPRALGSTNGSFATTFGHPQLLLNVTLVIMTRGSILMERPPDLTMLLFPTTSESPMSRLGSRKMLIFLWPELTTFLFAAVSTCGCKKTARNPHGTECTRCQSFEDTVPALVSQCPWTCQQHWGVPSSLQSTQNI